MRPRIVVLAEDSVGSYGEIARLYRATFDAMGLASDVRPYPASGQPRVPRGAVVIHATLGFRFTPLPGVTNIAVPFHEWSRYPVAWADRLSAFDQVWAATGSLAEVLRRSGVSAPIFVAPPALDRDPVPAKTAWRTSGPFRFLFVGEPHFRKGHHLLLAGFARLGASRRSATLTIKTGAACPWTVTDPRVQLVAARWPRARLLRLYARHDAFVSASLGEGLGLGVAEAMLARLPVAANHWGGHASLTRPGAYVRIPHRVVPQPFCSRPDFYAPGQACALSSPDDVAVAMTRLLDMSWRERRDQALRADAHLRRRFGLGPASARLAAALAASHE